MINTIIFFNFHQNGDILLSRGIVSWIERHISPNKVLMMAHCKGSHYYFGERVKYLPIVRHPDGTVTISLNMSMGVNTMFTSLRVTTSDALFVNLWLSSSPSFNQKISGINSDSLFNLSKEVVDIINSSAGESIPYPPSAEHVLPKVPALIMQKNKTEEFIKKIGTYKKRILLCNGLVESGQSEQFEMSSYIKDLVLTHPEYAFVYTAKDREPIADNEFFINEYLEIPNMDEIIHISLGCEVLIHRMSGPGIAISTYENFSNPNTTFITFTKDKDFTHLYKSGQCKYDWTDDHSQQSIVNTIQKYL
jgi:hypothetical protein